MNTTENKVVPTGAKISEKVGKFSLMVVLFLTNLGILTPKKIRNSAKKICDSTGTPENELEDFVQAIENKKGHSTLQSLSVPKGQLYKISYSLILYAVLNGYVVKNVFKLITFIFFVPFQMLLDMVKTAAGQIESNPVSAWYNPYNPVTYLTQVNLIIIGWLNGTGKWASERFSRLITNIVAQLQSAFPFTVQLEMTSISLEDFSGLLTQLIGDVKGILSRQATEVIFEQKGSLAKHTGCSVRDIVTYANSRKNPITKTGSAEYATAVEVANRFNELGLTDSEILSSGRASYTPSSSVNNN